MKTVITFLALIGSVASAQTKGFVRINKKTYFAILLFASNVLASSSQTFVCDMRDLDVNDYTTGLYKLEVSDDKAVLYAGAWGTDEAATLSLTVAASKSSTVYIKKDEKDRITQSFDLLASEDSGIFVWKNYSWKNPNDPIPVNTAIYICNKRP